MKKDLGRLEKRIGYTFRNKDLLITAMTHSSYHNENKSRPCNERLEFLGDAVLSVISANYLYAGGGDEGELSKTRATLVCEEALFDYGSELDLGDFLFLGKGEAESGKRRPSTVADAVEALIAAIYLDGGMEKASAFILPFLTERHEKVKNNRDYKTILQEIVQKNKGELLSYEHTGESGPEHNKMFSCRVLINSNAIAEGTGHSKKAAEQQAAKAALEMMGIKT